MAQKKISEYNSRRLANEHYSRFDEELVPMKIVQIDRDTNLYKLVEKEPWLLSMRLVVKMDSLFRKHDELRLVASLVDFPEAVVFMKEQLDKEVVMSTCEPKTTFLVEPYIPPEDHFYLSIVSHSLGSNIHFAVPEIQEYRKYRRFTSGRFDTKSKDKVMTICIPTGDFLTHEKVHPLHGRESYKYKMSASPFWIHDHHLQPFIHQTTYWFRVNMFAPQKQVVNNFIPR